MPAGGAEFGAGIGDRGWGTCCVLGSSAWLFRFLRVDDCFSALSSTTFAILSNSEHTPNIRFILPFSSSCVSIERKLTTKFMSLTSCRAFGSKGFCRILAKRVTSADTGKYKMSLTSRELSFICRHSQDVPDTSEVTLRNILD